MTTITQTIPGLGSPPLTTDPVNFDTRADTLYGTSLPAVITAINTWSGQANTVAGDVNTNASNAQASANTATAASAAAIAASNATQWVSGQAYVTGAVVWSPINFLSYRANTNTSGTTDPSISASWVLISANVSTSATQTLTNKTIEAGVLTDGYTEEVFAIPSSTTPALSPTNGSIQTWTLTGASTPTAGTWASGQSMTLMIDDGTAYTIDWSSVAVTWKTDSGVAPTLNTTGFTAIALWKVDTVIYGARVGNA